MRAQSMDMKDYIFRVIVPEQKEEEVKDGVTKEKVKKDNKKKNKSKKDKKNRNKSHKPKENKIKEKSIKSKEDKPKVSQDNQSSGIKFIVEEDVDENPVPKKEIKKESKTSKYIDNIADYFNGLNQSKDYKSSDDDSNIANKKNDYKSSKKDKSKDNKSDVIYNKKTSNKSKKNKNSKNNNATAVKQIKFKENIFSDIHEKMTKNEVNSNDLLKVQSIALDLELFENAYLAPVVHKQIISALKMNFSTRLFAESTLDIISSGEAISKIDKKFQDALLKIQIDFLRCDCNERPFCECLQRGISYYIINQRLNGKDPIDISNALLKEYQIQTYPGDIFSWLDTYVRNLDAIRRIAKAFGKKEIVQVSEKLMKIVESGK